jgi:hypothetical protein
MDKTNRVRKNDPDRHIFLEGTVGAAGCLVFAALLIIGCGVQRPDEYSPSNVTPVPAAGLDQPQESEMEQNKFVSEGDWGGNDIRLVVGPKRTTIEYPCADGEIAGRLSLNAKGEFTAAGTHKPLRPGPFRENDESRSEPARFEGRVDKDSMVLKVTLKKTNELIGNFTLRRNAATRLRRCM